MDQAKRYNKGKLRWALMDFESIEEALEILEFGAIKYGAYNWQKGLNREETLESAMRHLIALFKGEELDAESGKSHAAHVLVNMIFYLHYRKHNKFKEQRNNPFTDGNITRKD